jgi:hypothetical protein
VLGKCTLDVLLLRTELTQRRPLPARTRRAGS